METFRTSATSRTVIRSSAPFGTGDQLRVEAVAHCHLGREGVDAHWPTAWNLTSTSPPAPPPPSLDRLLRRGLGKAASWAQACSARELLLLRGTQCSWVPTLPPRLAYSPSCVPSPRSPGCPRRMPQRDQVMFPGLGRRSARQISSGSRDDDLGDRGRASLRRRKTPTRSPGPRTRSTSCSGPVMKAGIEGEVGPWT